MKGTLDTPSGILVARLFQLVVCVSTSFASLVGTFQMVEDGTLNYPEIISW